LFPDEIDLRNLVHMFHHSNEMVDYYHGPWLNSWYARHTLHT